MTQWQGQRRLYPHMNSCTGVGAELVCAASNYPAVPQTSAVEVFDTPTLKHIRSVSLGFGPGSLTVMDRHRDKWWAVFANYGKGGEPGRGYRCTVLARMAPKSCSGLSWGDDGLIYATGHDCPEIQALKFP